MADVLFLAICRSPSFVADDISYLHIFWGKTSCYFEWGLCQLNHFITLFSQQAYVYFGILALCVLLPIWLFIHKYSRNILISILSFVCLMYMFNAVNIVRQFLALAIILMSFSFVTERKFWLFLICVLLACLFHHSAILCISLYWLYTMKASAKNVGILLLGSVLIFIGFDQLASVYVSLDMSYSGYMTAAAQHARLSGVIRLMLNFIIMSAALCSLKHTPSHILEKAKINMNFLALCSCVSTSAALLSLQAYHVERIAYYFYIFNIITLPEVLVNISNKALKCIMYMIVLLCLFSYGFVVLWSWQQKGMIYSFMWS